MYNAWYPEEDTQNYIDDEVGPNALLQKDSKWWQKNANDDHYQSVVCDIAHECFPRSKIFALAVSPKAYQATCEILTPKTGHGQLVFRLHCLL